MPADDEPDPLGPARPLLVNAVQLGTKAADAGDTLGSYELLACAMRLARKIKGVSEVSDFRLERALDDAEGEQDPARQAETLLEASESLLSDDDEDFEDNAAVEDEMSAEPLAALQSFIEMAISIGAPAYNTGDHQGCFDVYSCTARMALSTVTGADDAKAKLREALDTCEGLDDSSEQAWAMRHAFDAIGEMGGGSAITPHEVLLYVSLAIRLGLPAANAGDHRGCYEVYACTARLLANASSVPESVKAPLRAALEQASTVPNVTRQAWILREAFDELLPKPDDAPEPSKD